MLTSDESLFILGEAGTLYPKRTFGGDEARSWLMNSIAKRLDEPPTVLTVDTPWVRSELVPRLLLPLRPLHLLTLLVLLPQLAPTSDRCTPVCVRLAICQYRATNGPDTNQVMEGSKKRCCKQQPSHQAQLRAAIYPKRGAVNYHATDQTVASSNISKKRA